MMRHLNRTLRGFSHLVVADTNFEVFTRACLGFGFGVFGGTRK